VGFGWRAPQLMREVVRQRERPVRIGGVMTLSRAVLLFVGLIGPVGARAQVPAVNTYRSDSLHFTVRYPASWHRTPPERAGVLDIINFPWSHRVHGVFLPRSGASLLTVAAPDSVSTIDDWARVDEAWMARDSASVKNLRRRDLTVSRPQAGGCAKLMEVQYDSEQGPGAYSHETQYYCAAHGRLFRVWLSNWVGNPSQSQLQAAALKVARSLRSW